MKLFITSITILIFSFQSYSQTLVNKGYVISNDSTVLMNVKNYREVRSKLSLADSLIKSSQLTIKLLTQQAIIHEQRATNTSTINTLQANQIKSLREANIELIKGFDRVTKNKWWESKWLYFGLGAGFTYLVLK